MIRQADTHLLRLAALRVVSHQSEVDDLVHRVSRASSAAVAAAQAAAVSPTGLCEAEVDPEELHRRRQLLQWAQQVEAVAAAVVSAAGAVQGAAERVSAELREAARWWEAIERCASPLGAGTGVRVGGTDLPQRQEGRGHATTDVQPGDMVPPGATS